jgi:formate-dependent nitrite reductase membrane component NrfD
MTMTQGLYWGLPVILYLFLAGMGAGTVTVSASMLLRGGGDGKGVHAEIARCGAILGPLPVILGCALLVLDLASFQAGHWFRFINLYRVINLSPMSIGTWLLSSFIVTSLAYAYTHLEVLPVPFGDRAALRRLLAWANVPLGLGVALYTGVLLGAMPARPFWNSPILALLFMLSALSTGTALIIFARALLHRDGFNEEQLEIAHRSGYLLAATDTMIIGFELLALFLFIMFAYLTVGNVRYAIATILPGGPLASLFWGGVVLIGLVLPGLLELYFVIPSLLYRRRYAVSRLTELAIAVAILFGGLLLRYVVVVAGQITGPVGL